LPRFWRVWNRFAWPFEPLIPAPRAQARRIRGRIEICCPFHQKGRPMSRHQIRSPALGVVAAPRGLSNTCLRPGPRCRAVVRPASSPITKAPTGGGGGVRGNWQKAWRTRRSQTRSSSAPGIRSRKGHQAGGMGACLKGKLLSSARHEKRHRTPSSRPPVNTAPPPPNVARQLVSKYDGRTGGGGRRWGNCKAPRPVPRIANAIIRVRLESSARERSEPRALRTALQNQRSKRGRELTSSVVRRQTRRRPPPTCAQLVSKVRRVATGWWGSAGKNCKRPGGPTDRQRDLHLRLESSGPRAIRPRA